MDGEKEAKKAKMDSASSPHGGVQEMFAACEGGHLEKVRSLLRSRCDCTLSDPDREGKTPLMCAAGGGHQAVVNVLIDYGAPWNSLDVHGMAAGDHAATGGHVGIYESLVDAGIRAELMLALLAPRDDSNQAYLKQKLIFEDGKILDANKDAVMMGWEAPLMRLHAQLMCTPNRMAASAGNEQEGAESEQKNQEGSSGGKQGAGDILNIGFGLGLIDGYAQDMKPRSHTIVEAHPDIYKHMIDLGWDKKPGVRILFGRWQDKLTEIQAHTYDGIFFDTYSEHYVDMQDFHEELPNMLREGGVYSFFNGLGASTNAFFHTVYCRLVELELKKIGFMTTYHQVSMDSSASDEWEGVKRKYWVLDTYNLPVVRYEGDNHPLPSFRPLK